ncbi:MAG: Maf family protein [Pseudomonadales bacterium]
MIDLVLASASPRRAALLRQLNLSFRIEPASIAEDRRDQELPDELVARLSRSKAQAVVNSDVMGSAPTVVIGADTIVVVGDRMLGKPECKDDAINMLVTLSGRQHRVLTAVTVADRDRTETIVVETIVVFRELTIKECERYWSTGEPVDKAGGYGIQGLGAIFVASITGSYSNVVGLPLMETADGLRGFGIDCL